MLFTSTATSLATAETGGFTLPGPAWAFGVTAFGFFMVLLGLLWSFRNTAARYDAPDTVSTARPHRDPHGSQGSHGATDHGVNH
jgi:hypothetical protein